MSVVKPLTFLGASLLVVQVGFASPFKFEVRADRPDHLYRCGETATFAVKVTDLKTDATNRPFSVRLDNFGDGKILERQQAFDPEHPEFRVSGTLKTPGFLRIILRNAGVECERWSVGNGNLCDSVGFEPDKIAARTACPEDFDAYWDGEMKRLAETVPLDAKIEPMPERNWENVEWFKVSFATFNGKRVYGFFYQPIAPGKYPVVITVPGAGPSAVPDDLATPESVDRQRIHVFLNVHCHPTPSDRAEAKKAYLGGNYPIWGFNQSREAVYYHDVMLGLNRAVDWFAARDNVDLKRFVYYGGSQGGAFGYYLMALNRHFSKGQVYISAMADLLAAQQGIHQNWPSLFDRLPEKDHPLITKIAPYYDIANFAHRIKCPVKAEAGMADMVCPATQNAAAFNRIAARDKEIHFVPSQGHTYTRRFAKEWRENWLFKPVGRTARTEADSEEVVVGGLAEAVYGDATIKKICEEKLGELTVLFCGPWTAEKLRAVGDICRKTGKKILFDEALNRGTGQLTRKYQPIWPEVRQTIEEYSDVIVGSNVMSEHGGVAFNWPQSTVEGFTTAPRPAKTYAEAEAAIVKTLKGVVAEAEAKGMPRPFTSIEPTMGSAWLFRGGIDAAHIEVIYGADLERRTSATLGAVKALSPRKAYGADMAMVWYGGNQHDGLWEKRWRTSLYHTYLRGANPIYSEHGIMDYHALGKRYEADHPDVVRYRKVLAEFAAWAKRNRRAKGLPQAAVAAVQGRFDSFVGGWQTHLYGQRLNDDWKVGPHEQAWELFNGLYQRQEWSDRNQCGDVNYSGNPPLGTADILPYDAESKSFNGYRTLFFLGRNSMDDALYGKLKAFVANGGHLLIAATHFDTAASPKAPFKPYRNGDWSELTGLKMVPNREKRYGYGLKFRSWSGIWDPWFTDGGFRMPVLEAVGAEILAAESDRFEDKECFERPGAGVVYTHRLGKGKVTFLASLDPVGADGVRNLYAYLIDRAMEQTDVWPKLDCSDRVRWAVYPDGTIYALNTETERNEEIVLRRSPGSAPERLQLAAGELREL